MKFYYSVEIFFKPIILYEYIIIKIYNMQYDIIHVTTAYLLQWNFCKDDFI